MGLFNNHGKLIIGSLRANAKPIPHDFIQIRVDRPSNSPLQNEIVLKDESQRHEVCATFKKILARKLRKKDPAVTKAVNEIVDLVRSGKNVALMCWCFPKECHAQAIVHEVNERLKG